jgi:hypothetical protein
MELKSVHLPKFGMIGAVLPFPIYFRNIFTYVVFKVYDVCK